MWMGRKFAGADGLIYMAGEHSTPGSPEVGTTLLQMSMGHVHGRATLSPNPETPFIPGPFSPHTLCPRHSTLQIASWSCFLPPKHFFRRFFPPSCRFQPPPVRATFFPQWPSKRLFLQPARPRTTLVRSHKVQSANQTSHITKASVVSPRIRIQDGGFSTRFGPSLCATSRRFFFFPPGPMDRANLLSKDCCARDFPGICPELT